MEGQLSGYLTIAGIVLVLLGITLIFIGVFASAVSGAGKVEAGGVVLIGPIPVIVGTSARAALLIAFLAVVMIVAYIILVLIMFKR